MKWQLNRKNKADGIKFLKSIKDNSIRTVFFDPQYRGILDKMKYGNEGKSRGKARSSLQQMDEKTIINFIFEINRILKKSGYLFIWVDKFHLVQGLLPWLQNTDLVPVDMITWDKGKFGMGYRTRRQSEYLIVTQKKPVKVKGTWSIHNIPDVWSENVFKTHPHSKPIHLQAELIKATTKINDIVVDPAAGGYSVLEACKATKRKFYGCDIKFGEK